MMGSIREIPGREISATVFSLFYLKGKWEDVNIIIVIIIITIIINIKNKKKPLKIFLIHLL